MVKWQTNHFVRIVNRNVIMLWFAMKKEVTFLFCVIYIIVPSSYQLLLCLFSYTLIFLTMLLFNTKGVFVDQILYLFAINSKVKGQVVRQFFVRSVIYIILLLHVSKQDLQLQQQHLYIPQKGFQLLSSLKICWWARNSGKHWTWNSEVVAAMSQSWFV